MRTGRPIAPLSLGMDERETLEGWARRPKTAQALAQRADCLGMRQRQSQPGVAAKLGLTYQTVGKWRHGSWRGGWQVCSTNRGQAPRAW